MDHVTIADIAQRSGVSKSAVSYALNGRPGVSASTRAKVLEVASELGWYPSASARALSGVSTRTIGIVLGRAPTLIAIEAYFNRFLSGVEQVLAHADHNLLLRMVAGERASLPVYERWWGERRIDGVLLMDELVDDPRLELVDRIGIPAVLMGGTGREYSIPAIITDQRADAQIAVDYLAGLGHPSLVHVTGDLRFLHEAARNDGVVSAAAAHGMDVVSVECDYTFDRAREITESLIQVRRPPSLILYSSDTMACAGLSAILEAGLRVPEDVSIMSWDDSLLCELVTPRLTALHRDPAINGAEGARMILDLVAGLEVPDRFAQPAKLQVRASTAACRR